LHCDSLALTGLDVISHRPVDLQQILDIGVGVGVEIRVIGDDNIPDVLVAGYVLDEPRASADAAEDTYPAERQRLNLS